MARVAAVAPDLLLGSKIEATLSAAGQEVTLSPRLSEAPLDRADLVVADLDVESAGGLVGLGVPVLGFYSHVNAETKRAADAAGIDLAVPRSRLARELPQLVDRLLTA
jgi:hypothetical protein